MKTKNLEPLKVLMMPDYRQDNPYQYLLAKALETERIPVIFPAGYRRVLPILRAVKDNSGNVLHLHWLSPYLKGKSWLPKSIYSFKFLVDIWLTRLMGVKVVWTIHNRVSHNCQFSGMELWLRKSLAKLVDRIIVHNSSTLDYLERDWKIDRAKIRVIPHGHYRDAYIPAISQDLARQQLNLPLNGRIYLNLGMLRPYKGIESLLEVWKNNRDLFKEHTLLIAGKALDESYSLKLAKLAESIPGVILHSDFIPNDRIHLFFSAADVVVLPFTNILTSGSLILAMSYGKPVIAPQEAGIIEVLGNANDLLYNSQETTGLLKALEKSIDINLDELTQKVVKNCDRLDWSLIALKTRQVYQLHKELSNSKQKSLNLSNQLK
jgi:glycosyltransferase involved in cell wall biosynthesis